MLWLMPYENQWEQFGLHLDQVFYPSLKVPLHMRVNYRKSYREHLATMFRRESKSWLAGSLLPLLRAQELRELSENEICLYMWE